MQNSRLNRIIGFRVSKTFYQRIQEKAKSRNLPVSVWIHILLSEYLKNPNQVVYLP